MCTLGRIFTIVWYDVYRRCSSPKWSSPNVQRNVSVHRLNGRREYFDGLNFVILLRYGRISPPSV